MITVSPLQNEEQLELLRKAAEEDHHCVLFPTHVAQAENSSEIIGYLSVLRTPMLHFWAHSKKMHPRDTYMLYNVAENLVRASGAPAVVTPCAAESPLNKFVQKVGYAPLGHTYLHIKSLT